MDFLLKTKIFLSSFLFFSLIYESEGITENDFLQYMEVNVTYTKYNI